MEALLSVAGVARSTVLDEELKKYKALNFSVDDWSLPFHGLSIFLLAKPTQFVPANSREWVILGLADHNPKEKHVEKFLNDYVMIRRLQRIDDPDSRDTMSGLLLIRGNFDEEVFNHLRARVAGYNERILESIHAKFLGKTSWSARKTDAAPRITLRKAAEAIDSAPRDRCRSESGYRDQLFNYLRGKGFDVGKEWTGRGSRQDLLVDDIIIELKDIKRKVEFDRLVGQIKRYLEERWVRGIIVVLVDDLGDSTAWDKGVRRIRDISAKIRVVERFH